MLKAYSQQRPLDAGFADVASETRSLDPIWSPREERSLLVLVPHGATRHRERISYRSVGQRRRMRCKRNVTFPPNL
jgi:hypothetical protein